MKYKRLRGQQGYYRPDSGGRRNDPAQSGGQYFQAQNGAQYFHVQNGGQYYPQNGAQNYPAQNGRQYYPQSSAQNYPAQNDGQNYPAQYGGQYYPQNGAQNYPAQNSGQYYPQNGGQYYTQNSAQNYPAQNAGQYYPQNSARNNPAQYGAPNYPPQNGTRYAPRQGIHKNGMSQSGMPRQGMYYAPAARKAPAVNGDLYKLLFGLGGMLLSVLMLMLTVMFIFSTASGGGRPVKDISRVKPGYEGKGGIRLSSLSELEGFAFLERRTYVLTGDVPCTQPDPYMNGDEYTHSPLNAGRGLMYGVDVSSRNGSVDWLSVRVSGIDFAILRAGSRGYTEGKIYEDKAFDTNARCAAAAGIKIGAYFYSQATNEEEIMQEAELLLRRVRGHDITMPVVLDFEFAEVDTGGEGGRLYDADLSVQQATDMCLLFCRTVREAGYTPMVYANTYMLTRRVDAERLAAEAQIWIAYPSNELKYEGANEMWQYSWSGRVPGIRGPVDMDFAYYDR